MNALYRLLRRVRGIFFCYPRADCDYLFREIKWRVSQNDDNTEATIICAAKGVAAARLPMTSGFNRTFKRVFGQSPCKFRPRTSLKRKRRGKTAWTKEEPRWLIPNKVGL